jgi:hypothetical protein
VDFCRSVSPILHILSHRRVTSSVPKAIVSLTYLCITCVASFSHNFDLLIPHHRENPKDNRHGRQQFLVTNNFERIWYTTRNHNFARLTIMTTEIIIYVEAVDGYEGLKSDMHI